MHHNFEISEWYKVLEPYCIYTRNIGTKDIAFKSEGFIARNKTFMILGIDNYYKYYIDSVPRYNVTFLVGLLTTNNPNYIFYSLLFANKFNYRLEEKIKRLT